MKYLYKKILHHSKKNYNVSILIAFGNDCYKLLNKHFKNIHYSRYLTTLLVLQKNS